jgi:hypothetical protein
MGCTNRGNKAAWFRPQVVEEQSPAPISSRCGRASMVMMTRPFEKKLIEKFAGLKKMITFAVPSIN